MSRERCQPILTGDSSPKGDLDIHVGTSEEPAEVTRFLPYPGRDAPRYGGKLRNADAETISLPGVGPHTHGAPIYENYRGDPPLRSVDALPVPYGDEVLPLLVAEEERIEVRQKADRWPFEPGPLELREVLPKDRRVPTVDTHRSDVRFFVRPDLTRIPRVACQSKPQSLTESQARKPVDTCVEVLFPLAPSEHPAIGGSMPRPEQTSARYRGSDLSRRPRARPRDAGGISPGRSGLRPRRPGPSFGSPNPLLGSPAPAPPRTGSRVRRAPVA